MPLVLQTLERRQSMVFHLKEREQQRQRHLQEMERLSTLGQFSAGVAHELNNAVAVIAHGPAWMGKALDNFMTQYDSQVHEIYRQGLEVGRDVSASDARNQIDHIQSMLNIPRPIARRLANIGLDDKKLHQLKKMIKKHPDELLNAWEIGATIHEMMHAAEHSSAVIESMKMLGAGDRLKSDRVSVTDTINSALTILRSHLSNIDVYCDIAPDTPDIMGNKGQLVQVWANIIKNSCEAMADMTSGEIHMSTQLRTSKIHGSSLLISICDTGPGIPDDILPVIFQPDITTKKAGLSFGLGIGLSIVQKIISSLSGTISAENNSTRVPVLRSHYR